MFLLAECFIYIILGYLAYTPIICLLVKSIILYIMVLFFLFKIWSSFVLKYCNTEINKEDRE